MWGKHNFVPKKMPIMSIVGTRKAILMGMAMETTLLAMATRKHEQRIPR
jgi:hypothetical protein